MTTTGRHLSRAQQPSLSYKGHQGGFALYRQTVWLDSTSLPLSLIPERLSAKSDRQWTGSVTISSSCRCAQVGDYGAFWQSLPELRHEAAVYEHLRAEQGISVPCFVARGHIVDTSFYFIATELLKQLNAEKIAEEGLEPAALHALERVHACGVLHG